MVASAENRLTDDQLVAQVNTMIIAATDTTSNVLSRTLHVLSERLDVQDKIRQEISDARANLGEDELTYDMLMELPWLDAICRETLRLYTPAIELDRVVTRDTVLPLSRHVLDNKGNFIHKIPLAKGTNVTFSIYGYNRSKDVWGPDATEWKPERWFSPLPESAKMMPNGTVYSNIMTFSAGKRACIGFKSAKFEMKLIFFYLVEASKFLPTDDDIFWNASYVVYPSTLENKRGR
ncbi:hypothetical protein EUX98_g2240 [Antrodiella citrinella]|uniref:Cytochrome P450 n=1 Tax=Antrodiella citrinella TaxID=2447956 RepID=A0A4S4MZG7_9APHY|nr:hypothetical protein EUX98_g2240 [Antrodiella citrinella]